MSTGSRSAVRRLATARLISITGGAAAYLALNYMIYERTGSAAWVAATLFLTFGTVGFVSPFAGALGDRFDRRKVMIASDLLGAACFLAMAPVESPGLLLALAFLSALAEAPFFSASSAAIPNLVAEDDLGWANGMVSLGRNSGILVGPLIAGVLVASVGGGAVFAMNAVTFVVSAALVATVRGRFSADREEGGEFSGLRAGFRFLFGDPMLRTISLSWLVLTLGLGMSMVADVPLVDLFDAGSWGYGLLIACWGAGTIVGSLAGRYVNLRTEPSFLLGGAALVVLAAIAVGLSPWFWLVLAAVFVMGIGDGASLVAEQGIMQRRTPDAVRSRVSGAFDSVVHIGLAVSYLAAGPAVEALGARGVYLFGGGLGVVALLLAFPILRMRGREGVAVEVQPPGAEADEPAVEPSEILLP